MYTVNHFIMSLQKSFSLFSLKMYQISSNPSNVDENILEMLKYLSVVHNIYSDFCVFHYISAFFMSLNTS